MAEGVLMPKAGITVESCIIGTWKKNVGDPVSVGDILFTYETDKAEFECESTAAGTLLEKFYENGDEVPCLVNVCAVGNPGEDVSALRGAGTAAPAAAAAQAAPAAAAPAAAAVPAGQVAEAVVMPKAGITVESCIIGEWKKNVGDSIAVGDVLFTYETDKAEFECESTAAGTLLARFYENGDEVPCLVNVCAVGKSGDDYECLRGASGTPTAAPAEPAASPAAAPVAAAAAPAGPSAEAVIMPKAGITVESCIIGEWKKNVGDSVALGDILFTYETDKAEFECESTAAGTLLARFYENGDEVPCLENVCAVGQAGDAFEHLRPGSKAPAPAAAPAPAGTAAAPASAPAAPKAISPRAKNLAERAGVDAAYAAGTGPNGRVIERDIRKLMEEGVPAKAEVAAPAPAAAPAVSAPAAAAPVSDADYEDVKFSSVRKATAKAMVRSLTTMAQLTQQFSFDASQIQAYRKMVKATEGDLSKISLNDMVMFAVSRTLLGHPDLNANMLEENMVRRFKHVHLGFACDTPRGLLVPTIFNADQKSLLEISVECKQLAAEAREGKLGLEKLQGATFTVTNLGSMGCEAFTPVINPPQTGILGVCNIQSKVRASKDGGMELYPAMGLSLTFDHRVVDGAPAARFMAELCKNLESFMTLLAK